MSGRALGWGQSPNMNTGHRPPSWSCSGVRVSSRSTPLTLHERKPVTPGPRTVRRLHRGGRKGRPEPRNAPNNGTAVASPRRHAVSPAVDRRLPRPTRGRIAVTYRCRGLRRGRPPAAIPPAAPSECPEPCPEGAPRQFVRPRVRRRSRRTNQHVWSREEQRQLMRETTHETLAARENRYGEPRGDAIGGIGPTEQRECGLGVSASEQVFFLQAVGAANVGRSPPNVHKAPQQRFL